MLAHAISQTVPFQGTIESRKVTSSQRAYSLGSCDMGQTDVRQADGRIVLFQNAP